MIKLRPTKSILSEIKFNTKKPENLNRVWRHTMEFSVLKKINNMLKFGIQESIFLTSTLKRIFSNALLQPYFG